MAKLAQDFAKYMIIATVRTNGVVERPDVIGAIFGQTEGLLGSDLDLRELQQTGKLGRINVNVNTKQGKSVATVTVPCSLDASEVALIAASLETIEKVGPCKASIEIKRVDDVRSQKRRYMVDRAKEILKLLMDEGMPDSHKITEMIKRSVRTWEVSDYHGLSCGPHIQQYNEIIIVEGRADVINLLKNGIKNVIAVDGSDISNRLAKLTERLTTTVFFDGDRGGMLNLKKLISIADVDYVVMAPKGSEVEDLSKKQIHKYLRGKMPLDQFKSEHGLDEIKKNMGSNMVITSEKKTFFKARLNELIGSRAVLLVNGKQVMAKIPLSELGNVLNEYSNVNTLIFDGKINQEIVDLALQRKIKYLAGMDQVGDIKHSSNLKTFALEQAG